MPGWKKILTTALIVVVTLAVVNRVAAKKFQSSLAPEGESNCTITSR